MQDEFVHGFGEAFLFIGGRDVGGGFLDFGAGVAHGDADSTFTEHEDVVGHVADGGDLVYGRVQKLGHGENNFTLVGFGVGDVEIVWLRTRGGSLISAGVLRVFFATLHGIEIVADADHFGDFFQQAIKLRNDRGRKFSRPLLACYVRSLDVTHKPIEAGVYPAVNFVN